MYHLIDLTTVEGRMAILLAYIFGEDIVTFNTYGRQI